MTRTDQTSEVFVFSGLSRRCSRCRITVDLLTSELVDGAPPKGQYLCADCDVGLYPDPREGYLR